MRERHHIILVPPPENPTAGKLLSEKKHPDVRPFKKGGDSEKFLSP